MLPQRNEARRHGLEVLSLLIYDGPAAAAHRLASLNKNDPDMVFAITTYYLKGLGEYVEYAAAQQGIEMGEVLQMMGRRILETDFEAE